MFLMFFCLFWGTTKWIHNNFNNKHTHSYIHSLYNLTVAQNPYVVSFGMTLWGCSNAWVLIKGGMQRRLTCLAIMCCNMTLPYRPISVVSTYCPINRWCVALLELMSVSSSTKLHCYLRFLLLQMLGREDRALFRMYWDFPLVKAIWASRSTDTLLLTFHLHPHPMSPKKREPAHLPCPECHGESTYNLQILVSPLMLGTRSWQVVHTQ